MLADPQVTSRPDYETITYAALNGISYEEGKRRFDLINKLRNLESILTRDNPNTFAGLWIEHQPRFKIVVQFVGEPQKDISNYIKKELQDVIEVRRTETSLVDLEKLRSDALDIIATEGEIPIESSLNVQKNRVELYVTQENYVKTNKIIQNTGLNFYKKIAVIKAQVLTTH